MGAPWCCGRAVASTPPRVLLRCRHTSSRSDRGRSETANPPDRVRQVRQQGVSVAKSRGFSHSSRGNGQICNFSYRGWGPAGRQRQQRPLGSTDWAPTQAGRSTPRKLIHGRFNLPSDPGYEEPTTNTRTTSCYTDCSDRNVCDVALSELVALVGDLIGSTAQQKQYRFQLASTV